MSILNLKNSFEEISAAGGGKAKNLKRLYDLDIPIPTFIVISDDFFQNVLKTQEIPLELTITSDVISESKRIQALFEEMTFNQEQKSLLKEELEKNNLLGEQLAIRSSGMDEDSKEYSFAGMFSSFLFQKSFEDIEKSIIACWKSAFSERCLSYREKSGLLDKRIQMGVVIQKMIDSDSSGVMFSRNPIDLIDRKNIIIESVFGQCEGLVSGVLDSDKYKVDRSNMEIKSDPSTKEFKFIRDPNNSGLVKVDLNDSEKEIGSISEESLKQLAQIAIKLEENENKALDIEWAIEDGNVYFVQMRPITNLPELSFYDPSINGEEATLWDNSNIVESFAGITSPLTFSLSKEAYAIVYRQTCRLVGVPEKFIADFDESFNNMLGSIRGRVYYNLIHWYKLLFIFPGASSNKEFMETMMGVQEELNSEQRDILNFVEESPKYSAFMKIKVTLKFIHHYFKIKKTTAEFRKMFNDIYEEYYEIDFSKKTLREQKAYYERWNNTVSYSWNAPIINDFLVMMFFGILKKITTNWISSDKDSAHLQNDLLCGQGDVDSTLPTLTLMRLAESYDQNDMTANYILNKETSELVDLYRREELKHGIQEDIGDYLTRYGFRCNHEQKLEGEDLHTNPSFIFDNLSNYIKTKSYSTSKMYENEIEIKEKAEALVDSQLGPIKRRLFYWVLNRARFFVKNRENLRFLRSKSFGISRRIFKSMAKHLEDLGIVEDSQDTFYLHYREIFDFIEGKAESLSLGQIAKIRRAEYENYELETDPPDRFIAFGANGVSLQRTQVVMSGDLLKNKLRQSDDPNLFYGISCCPGVITASVVVASDIDDAKGMNGEILVTKRTDPGWVPLFPFCGGLIVERGSLLSHSAVIARELGVPTIVGISSELLERLNTGDKVELNATTGEVRIINED